jgi:transcriptional regulator with XRE-family HTH domain
MTIGEKIKVLRKEKGVTQRKMAEETFLSKTAISYWETEKNEPTVYNCIVMADYFNISLDELCCRKRGN